LLGSLKAAYSVLEEHAARLRPKSVSIQETLVSLEAIHQSVNRLRPNSVLPHSVEWEAFQQFQRIKIACEEARLLFGAEAEREQAAALACHRLWVCAIETWKAYQTAKKRQGKLDQSDLEAEGVALLEKSQAVRMRYQKRFKHLMVDEFQDTNPLQMRLIRSLHVPQGVAGGVPSNHLFVVGDVQQSIYGFRNADPSLFRILEREFREHHAGAHVSLADNFRSRDEILRTVRQVFQQVWRDEATPFVPLRCGAEFHAKDVPSVEILVSQGVRRGDYTRLEADALAARIRQMVEGQELALTAQSDTRCGEPIAYRDIAILLRAGTDIPRYEEAFVRRGVPYYVVGGGRGYYARTEIRDLLNVLTIIETPLDDIALAAALRSPFVGANTDTLYHLTRLARRAKSSGGRDALYPSLRELLLSGLIEDKECAKITRFLEVIEDLRAQEDRIPVGHLLERLITRTHYDACLLARPGGRRRLANIRKLLQMANVDSVIGVRSFILRLRDLEKLSEREGDAPTEEEAADVVRFLTIHTAKGLEFPVVIVADLSRTLIFEERGTFVCDAQSLAVGTKLGGTPNLAYKAIVQQRQKADKAEYERLLYVAMTRAREHLILCGDTGRNTRYNWASALFPLLGILDAPPQPERRMLSGGIEAQVAPLSHYADIPYTPETLASFLPERSADAIARELLSLDTQCAESIR
jgi:ATP-dependent helicase/nuclease subunit A